MEEDRTQIDLEKLLNKENAEDYIFNKSPMLLDNNKNWWIWSKNKKKWVIVDDIDVVINIDNLVMLKEEIYKQHVKRALLNLLEMICRRKFNKVKKFEDIGIEEGEKNNGYVCFKNCIRKIGVNRNIENSHEFFIKTTIPYDYMICDEESLKVDKFDKLFIDWVGEKDKLLLYQIVGYCLVDGYPIHTLFCLNGSGRNGKSTFLKIIQKSVGEDNVLTSSLEQLLHNRFETSRLYGKLACLMGETNFNLLRDTDTLKKITGDDLIRGEYKMKSSFDFITHAKIIIATNSIPITLDRTDGFYSRWIIQDFLHKFESKGDILGDITEKEWEMFVNKCYREIEKAISKGEFHNQGTIEDRRKRFEERSNPIKSFFEQYYILDKQGQESIYDFYESAMAYFEKNNYRKISKQAITEYLVSNFGIEKDKIAIDGKQYWVYAGIRRKKEFNNIVQDKSYTIDELGQEIYTKEEIIKHLKKNHYIKKEMLDEDIIKQAKKDLIIYEPKNDMYKIVKSEII